MKIRILAAVGAIVLAIVGVMLLAGYVGAADARARNGARAVDVYVVRALVPAGTPASKLSGLVEVKSVTAGSLAEGAVTSLQEIAGKVPTVDLVPGEQLLESRFADPAAKKETGSGKPTLPAGMQRLSIQLEPQRVIGGDLTAGDTVGVFVSLDKENSGNPAGNVTHLTAQKVLVLTVTGATPLQAANGSSTSGAAAAPAATTVLVTLAVNAPTAEKIVFGSEFGKVWLSKQVPATTETGTQELTKDNVYK